MFNWLLHKHKVTEYQVTSLKNSSAAYPRMFEILQNLAAAPRDASGIRIHQESICIRSNEISGKVFNIVESSSFFVKRNRLSAVHVEKLMEPIQTSVKHKPRIWKILISSSY